MDRDHLVPVGPCAWEIPTGCRSDMLVPARIFADDVLLDGMLGGDAIRQLLNVATLPGIVRRVYGMPDMHDGYGFPVGGVAATKLPDGMISPGGVGFDINCGVRLLVTPLTLETLGDRHAPLVHEISRAIPAGSGRAGHWSLTDAELDAVLVRGSEYLVRERGMGIAEDLDRTEDAGTMAGAEVAAVSSRARERGRDQLGTIGSGNHFIELDVVETILDAAAAEAFGLVQGRITVLIHCGSRGLGHQVCTDYVKRMDGWLARHAMTLPDRQLSCAPASSMEGRQYLGAMAAAANFAWANRQLIAHRVREVVMRLFPEIEPAQLPLVYDVAHNVARAEVHGGELLCVQRKGATRALAPGDPVLPAAYREAGQPVFIPGSMGSASFVLAGVSTAEERALSSACHGAGRALSRSEAKRRVAGSELRKQLEAQGIVVRCPSSTGLAEEAPLAYKDVERVVEVVEHAGLARRVARLRPVGVVKG